VVSGAVARSPHAERACSFKKRIDRGAGFCRGAPPSHMDRLLYWRKKFGEFWKFSDLSVSLHAVQRPGSFWGSLGSRSRSHGCKLREQPILLKANLLSEGFHESWHALLRYPSSFSSPRIGALLQTGLNELGRCSPPAELASGPEHENSYTLALIVFRRGDIGMRLASDNFIP
jgi:hypothetical protein